MAKYIEKAISISTFKSKHKLAPTVTDLSAKKFQNWEKKTGSFYLKTRRLEPKAKLWLAEPLVHCPDIYKGNTSSSYKFDEFLCALFDPILEMISPSEFLIRCIQKKTD